jgi:hypothetical protein
MHLYGSGQERLAFFRDIPNQRFTSNAKNFLTT